MPGRDGMIRCHPPWRHSPRPGIIVDRPVALYDAPITIALKGFVPGTCVTVTATLLHGPFEPHDPPEAPPYWTSGGRRLPCLREHNVIDDPTSVDYTTPPVAESPRYCSQLRDVNAVE
jgi:hypothetical protein